MLPVLVLLTVSTALCRRGWRLGRRAPDFCLPIGHHLLAPVPVVVS
jgi:hypothetical protein